MEEEQGPGSSSSSVITAIAGTQMQRAEQPHHSMPTPPNIQCTLANKLTPPKMEKSNIPEAAQRGIWIRSQMYQEKLYLKNNNNNRENQIV